MPGSPLHQPLPDPFNSIRLLSIDPGWPSDPIRARLTVVPDRSAAPPYQALSYVWGDTANPVSIECNGVRVLVTPHLAAALRALRPLPTDGDPVEHNVPVMEPSHILHSNQRVWKGIARNRNESEVVAVRRASRNGSGPLFWIDAICINQN